jgi:acetyltransferase (GNAT) family protein
MYVAPEARGLGVGRALVAAAVEAAADLGFEVLRLETHADIMPVAVKMYRELGFRDAEPYHSVVGVEGLLTMELHLPGRTQPGSPKTRRSDRGRRSRCRTGAMRPSENSASRHSEYAEVGTGS